MRPSSASPANRLQPMSSAAFRSACISGKHGKAAGDVEPADDHRDAGLAQRPRDVERARKLVRLHADQPHHAEAAMAAQQRDDVLDLHPRVGLVDGGDVDRDLGAEDLALRRIRRERVDAGERVRGDRGAHPLDDVAVVVVVRRLDQDELETDARSSTQAPAFWVVHQDKAALPSKPIRGENQQNGAFFGFFFSRVGVVVRAPHTLPRPLEILLRNGNNRQVRLPEIARLATWPLVEHAADDGVGLMSLASKRRVTIYRRACGFEPARPPIETAALTGSNTVKRMPRMPPSVRRIANPRILKAGSSAFDDDGARRAVALASRRCRHADSWRGACGSRRRLGFGVSVPAEACAWLSVAGTRPGHQYGSAIDCFSFDFSPFLVCRLPPPRQRPAPRGRSGPLGASQNRPSVRYAGWGRLSGETSVTNARHAAWPAHSLCLVARP